MFDEAPFSQSHGLVINTGTGLLACLMALQGTAVARVVQKC